MLGARSQRLIAYLSPTVAPTQEAVPATVAPTVMVATVEPASPIPPPPTATASPQPTNSPTPEPQEPRGVVRTAVRICAVVRQGLSGDWPVARRPGNADHRTKRERRLVADRVHRRTTGLGRRHGGQRPGAIDTVAVTKNIPAPPTAAPRPMSRRNRPPHLVAGPDFRLESIRLWNVTENGGYYDSDSTTAAKSANCTSTLLTMQAMPWTA